MSKHKVRANTYIVLVDSHRGWDCWKRQTQGRYRVGAKSPEDAEEILRKRIGFGSIRTYYKTNPDDLPQLERGEIIREVFGEVRHATDSVERVFDRDAKYRPYGHEESSPLFFDDMTKEELQEEERD